MRVRMCFYRFPEMVLGSLFVPFEHPHSSAGLLLELNHQLVHLRLEVGQLGCNSVLSNGYEMIIPASID